MAKVINITDKLSKEKSQLVMDDKSYPVDNSVETILMFEELASASTRESMVKAVKLAVGEEAAKEINIMKMPIENFKVVFIGIFATMMDMEYAEAEKRFQKFTKDE